jgi:glycosyltransferase involved in cell wall biosynthesis
LKILVCTDFTFPSYNGGSARFTSETILALEKYGVNLDVVTRKGKGIYAGINLGPKKFLCTNNPLQLIYYNIRHYDVVLSHHPIYAFIPALTNKNNLVYFFHGPFAEEYFAKTGKKGIGYFIRMYLENIVLTKAKKIIVVSNYMQNFVNGYDEKVLNLGPIQTKNDGQKLIEFRTLASKDRIKIIMVRRLTKRTGVQKILELIADCSLFEITVVGSGELRTELIVKYGRRVRFLERVSDSELLNLYQASDIMILPSLDYEGFGLVILEAMSAGCPILVSKTSGGAFDCLREIGIKSFIDFSNDDTESITKKIIAVTMEYQNTAVQTKATDLLKNSFYLAYGKRLIDVL